MVTETDVQIAILIGCLIILAIAMMVLMAYRYSPRGDIWWMRKRYGGGTIEAIFDWLDNNRVL